MDAVPGRRLRPIARAHRVALDPASVHVGEVDAEEGVVDLIAGDGATLGAVDANRGAVFDVARAHVAEAEAAHRDVVRPDEQDAVRAFAVQHGSADADQLDRLRDLDDRLAVITRRDDDAAARPNAFQRLRDGAYRTRRRDGDFIEPSSLSGPLRGKDGGQRSAEEEQPMHHRAAPAVRRAPRAPGAPPRSAWRR